MLKICGLAAGVVTPLSRLAPVPWGSFGASLVEGSNPHLYSGGVSWHGILTTLKEWHPLAGSIEALLMKRGFIQVHSMGILTTMIPIVVSLWHHLEHVRNVAWLQH